MSSPSSHTPHHHTKPVVLAFDVYGTLLSTSSIASELQQHLGAEKEKAQDIATAWRRYQLEYTWRLTAMEKYIDFTSVTSLSLRHALRETNLTLSPTQHSTLMQSYNNLHIFPDVPPLFSALSQTNIPFHPVLFSNGTTDMLRASLHQSPGLSPHAQVFRDIVSIDDQQENKVYKPAPQTYEYLLKRTGMDRVEEGKENTWLVSSNPFDVVGAGAVGLRTCWVDRGEVGWVDALGDGLGRGEGEGEGDDGVRPTVVVKGVGEVVGAIAGVLKEREREGV